MTSAVFSLLSSVIQERTCSDISFLSFSHRFLQKCKYHKCKRVRFTHYRLKELPYTIQFIMEYSPLYTDTRYNDKIRYNDNLNVTKPQLKR